MQIQYEYCSFLETIIVVILIVLKYNHLFGLELVPAIFQGYITWIKAQWPAHIRYCMQRNPSISCIHPDSSSDLSTSQYCKRPQRLWPLHHAHTQSSHVSSRGGGGKTGCHLVVVVMHVPIKELRRYVVCLAWDQQVCA